MKMLSILLSLTALLTSGCTKPPATSPPIPITTTASASPLAPASLASPVSTPGVIAPLYSLDPSALSDLPVGIKKVADQKGRSDQALAFDGKDTKIELPWDISAEKHPQLTIAAWARFTGDPLATPQYQVISSDDGDYDRSLGLDGRAGQWGWSAFAGEGGVMGGLPVQPGDWIFLAVTYDQTSSTSQLTVGNQKAPEAKGAIGKSHPFIWIGGNPSFGEYFIGDIAHVEIFDRILSAEEIARIREQ